MSPPTRNRRLDSRRAPKRSTRVTCRKGSNDLGQNLAVALLDASSDGVRLLVSAALPPGQEVTIELEGVSHRRPLRLTGKVVWCAQSGDAFAVGVKLEKPLPHADLLKIA